MIAFTRRERRLTRSGRNPVAYFRAETEGAWRKGDTASEPASPSRRGQAAKKNHPASPETSGAVELETRNLKPETSGVLAPGGVDERVHLFEELRLRRS